MADFKVLPRELVLQIFSKIKYEDRFETCQVSYEWFLLTLTNYTDRMTSKNDLLVAMADFFNTKVGAKKYSSWMQLFRFMKPTKAEISSSDSRAYIKSVEQCKSSIEVLKMDMDQFLTNFWTSYPKLRHIHVRNGFVPEYKEMIIKEAFGSLFIPQLLYISQSRRCFDFRLKRSGSFFALSMVGLQFNALPKNILTAALKAIKESETVETFVIVNPVITTNWKKVFPPSVRRLFVMDPVIEDSAVTEVKDLLFFLCNNFTSLIKFDIGSKEIAKYQCFPRNKEERFHIWWPETPSQFTNGFERSYVRIDRLRGVEHLKSSLPASVITLQLAFSEFPNDFSPKQLFANSPKLETLAVEMPMVKNISFGDFSGLNSLHTLILDYIGPKALETIFLSLPSLKNLGVKKTEEETFTLLPDRVVSASLTALTVTDSSLNSNFILNHVPNLKKLFIYQYDPRKHQVGFLCNSFYNLELIVIVGKYDQLLCRSIGSDMAGYPYKCIIADSRFFSVCYTYSLTRNVELVRKLVIEDQARAIQKMTVYVHGFSVAFVLKNPKVETYFEVEQFLNVVDWTTREDAL